MNKENIKKLVETAKEDLKSSNSAGEPFFGMFYFVEETEGIDEQERIGQNGLITVDVPMSFFNDENIYNIGKEMISLGVSEGVLAFKTVYRDIDTSLVDESDLPYEDPAMYPEHMQKKALALMFFDFQLEYGFSCIHYPYEIKDNSVVFGDCIDMGSFPEEIIMSLAEGFLEELCTTHHFFKYIEGLADNPEVELKAEEIKKTKKDFNSLTDVEKISNKKHFKKFIKSAKKDLKKQTRAINKRSSEATWNKVVKQYPFFDERVFEHFDSAPEFYKILVEEGCLLSSAISE